METEISVNKIISILVAIVVASCVLIPICNSLGSTGNSNDNGNSDSGRSTVLMQEMAYWGGGGVPGDYPYIYSEDYELRDYVINDGMNYNIRFVPGHDGLTYTDGEIVMLINSYYNNNSEYTNFITYSNNKFHISIIDSYSNTLTTDCVGFVLGIVQTGSGSSQKYIVPLDSVSDTDMKTQYDSDASSISGDGYVKLRSDYEGQTYYITDNPNITISVDDYASYLALNDDNWDGTRADIQYVYGWDTLDGELYSADSSLDWDYIDDDDHDYDYNYSHGWYVEYPKEIHDTVRYDGYPNIKSIAKEPYVSMSKWNNTDIDGDIFKTKYLVFNTSIPFTSEGGNNGGNGGSDNGVVGTLITIIPVFVLLAILGMITKMMIDKKAGMQ